MLPASLGDRRRIPVGLLTASPLSRLFHTSFVKRTVITLEESLEKSVQIERDWKTGTSGCGENTFHIEPLSPGPVRPHLAGP